MCRLLAYQGAPIPLERMLISPCHSLLHQSREATEAKLSVNGDGFGVAWYCDHDPQPGLYRDTLPAWSDANLTSLCRVIRAPLFLAHVRAATFGDTSRMNCHPFTFDQWSFAHNGQLADFADHRRTYEALLPDDLYRHRKGVTDSEILFLLMIANGLTDAPERAMRSTLNQIATLAETANTPSRLACVLSNGTDVWAVRWSSDARSPSLYVNARPLMSGGTAFSSEPLDGDPTAWRMLPEGSITRLQHDAQPDTLVA